MERLKHMKESIMSAVQSQLGNLAAADTKELGEAIDMIKDLEEAIYYCSVVEAMEETKKEKEEYKRHPQQQHNHYYTNYLRYIEPYIDEYQNGYGQEPMHGYRDGRMYYDGNGGRGGNGSMSNGNGRSGNGGNGSMSYYDRYDKYPMEIRDYREGKSPMSRRSYMEGKEMHKDKSSQMQELEKYLMELSQDVTEMITDASPEEKVMLQQKLTTLAQKVK